MEDGNHLSRTGIQVHGRMIQLHTENEDIGNLNNNFKDGKLKCFNCNKYRHIAKECWKKKEKDMRKYFKYKKIGHIAKDCKEK